MDTMFPHYYVENPYASPRWSRQRKVVFALDLAGRLQALDPVFFAEGIIQLKALARALSLAGADTGTAIRQQAGDTRAVDAGLQQIRDVVSGKYGVLKDTLGKNNPALGDIFGKHLSTYTQELTLTNYDERIGTLLMNMQAQKVDKNIVAAVQSAVQDLLDLRDAQTEKKGITTTSYSAGSAADTALNTALFSTTGTVMTKYPSDSKADAAARHDAYNFALLPAPHHGGAAQGGGFVGGLLTVEALADLPAVPRTKAVLRNVGNVRLRFGLSADPLTPFAGGLEVLPGATMTCTLADLGDPLTQSHLLVQNPTSEVGEYSLTVG